MYVECGVLYELQKNNRDTRASLTRFKRDVVFKQRTVIAVMQTAKLPESQ